MTHAYQEIYLSNAQAALGNAFDYAIRVCGVPGENFIKLFTVSSVSKHMENGEPAYLAGKSGIELAAQILAETTGTTNLPEPPERYARSCVKFNAFETKATLGGKTMISSPFVCVFKKAFSSSA